MQRSKEEKAIVEYLLGQADESEQNRIETAYFHDPEYHEQILTLEDDLISDYLNNKLSGKERGLFEQHFLASHRRHSKYEFTKRLTEYANESVPKAVRMKSENTASWWSWLFPVQPKMAWSLVVAAALCGGMWWALNSSSIRSNSSQTGSAVEFAEQKPLSPELPLPTSQSSPSQVEISKQASSNGVSVGVPKATQQKTFTFTLAFSTVRGEPDEQLTVRVPAGYEAVQLLAQINDHPLYASYEASIKTVENEKIAYLTRLKGRADSNGAIVPVTVSAKQLPQANYVLAIYGITKSGQSVPLGDMLFNVSNH